VQAIESCSELLRHCPRLFLDLVDKRDSFDYTCEETFDVLLASLSKAWQLDASLLGQAGRISGAGSHAGAAASTHASSQPTDGTRSCSSGDGWMLKLCFFKCSGTALGGLPQGLTHLELV
jgi:hypothetical protein